MGLCFTALYFIVFRFLILKFDFKTPGRESDDEQVEFKSKKQYIDDRSKTKETAADESVDKNLLLAQNILNLLGGAENIVEVTNCVTRLRVNVYDETLVGSDSDFKAIGARGISKNGKAMQVIVGLKVATIRERFESLL